MYKRQVLTFIPTKDSTINFEFSECTDADSNHYAIVTIGTQTWMAENLKTTKYLNGDQIPSPLCPEQWIHDSVGAFKIGSEIYGNMYNAYAVEDSRKLCPAGWHVPSASEWDALLIYLGGESIAGGPLKEAGTSHWLDPNVGAANQSGFTALPAGNINPLIGYISIKSIGMNAVWWSCSKEDLWFWTVQCSFASTDAVRTEWDMCDGLSVRCIKGDPDPSTLVIHPIGQGNNNCGCPAAAETEPVTDLTATGVTLNGTVYASGLPTTVTFEYAPFILIPLSDVDWQPVTADQSPLSGDKDVQVSTRLEGLSRGTYMYRVKAVNSLGTQYGSIFEVDILGTGGQSPTITTLAATDLSSHTATFNATVNPHGLMTGVSFEWGTTTDYGADVLVNWYSEDTVYNVSLTWYYFEDGVTYHYRAIAGNMEEVVYGKDMELTIRVFTAKTLEATNVEPAAATLNGIVNANNLPTIVTFEYGTSTDYGQEITAEQSPVEGITDKNVSAALTGLTGGTKYYYRVKAVNSSGTIYGDNMIFNSAHLPVLTTTPASDITATSAISGGNITDDGGAAITDRGIFYSTGPIPNRTGRGAPKRTHDGTGTGSFTSTITGLSPNTTYHLRAYAVNSAGLAYGDIITFTTTPPCDQVPIAVTSAATDISSTGATLNGRVNANGSYTTVTFEYTTYGRGGGFVWNTVTAIQSPITGTTLTNVSAVVTGLRSGTTHLFKVKAENSCGTVEGKQLSFTLH